MKSRSSFGRYGLTSHQVNNNARIHTGPSEPLYHRCFSGSGLSHLGQHILESLRLHVDLAIENCFQCLPDGPGCIQMRGK